MKIRKLFIIPLSALLLSGCTIGGGGGGGGGGGKKTSNPGGDTTPVAGEIPDGAYDGYYNLSKYNLNGLKGPNLQRTIHNMMLDTHQFLIRYSVFSSFIKQTTDRKYSIDQVNATTNKNEFFYTGKQNTFTASMQREHVWPCAKSAGMWTHKEEDGVHWVDGSSYVGGGSDLYHIRPCTGSVNKGRGDSRFIEFTAEQKASGNLVNLSDGGPYTLLADDNEYAQYSEPADEFKGDIARICFYVYIHYAAIGNYGMDTTWKNYLGNLSLQDLFGLPTDTEKAVNEQLVRWNELDPVSETEKLRNETVFGIQGNRNPFVDYPHLMRQCLIF